MGDARIDHLAALGPVYQAAQGLTNLAAGDPEPNVLDALRALRELEVANGRANPLR